MRIRSSHEIFVARLVGVLPHGRSRVRNSADGARSRPPTRAWYRFWYRENDLGRRGVNGSWARWAVARAEVSGKKTFFFFPFKLKLQKQIT
jgi:hypothetical protein